jgi:ComF family protein
LGCKKEGLYLCDDCRSLLDISEYNYCLCDRPQRLPFQSKTGKCNKCSDKKLSGLYFALPYKEKNLTKKLIHQFKYQPYLKDLSETLASVLIEHFVLAVNNTEEIWQNSVLVPVPIHIKKFRERGYNQSEELAKELSKILKTPVISDVLIKIKETPPQMELNKSEREKNLLGAFALKKTHTSDVSVFNKKVFLVDDVYTTGSTMNECAKVLKKSGVKTVWGISLAREG